MVTDSQRQVYTHGGRAGALWNTLRTKIIHVIGDKILINSDGKMSAKIMLPNHTDDNDLDQSFFKQQLVKN